MTGRRRLPADLGPRIAVAVPAAAVLVALTVLGDLWFAVPLGLVGAGGLLELGRMFGVPRAALVPGALAVAAAPVLVHEDLQLAAVLLAAASVAVAAGLAPAARRRAALLVTAGGTLWLGGCLAHAVLLRELDEGVVLVVAVLLATFLGDTAAQLGGTAFGRHRLAAVISPNKTVEGLAAGIVTGTLACLGWAIATGEPLSAGDGLVLGLACAIAAPVGDLLESALKRRAGVKDSGTAFGAHGGVLDRIDAVIVAAAVGYHVARALT